jgi:hypothetical protein
LLAEAVLEDKLVVMMPFQEGLNGVNWLLKFAWILTDNWQNILTDNWEMMHFAVTDNWQLAMI